MPAYGSVLMGSAKERPVSWRWPSFWGLVVGATVQFMAGIVPTMLSFLILVAADERRWPWAVGASPMRPFFAWVLGAMIGIGLCETMTVAQRRASMDWVFWGATTELWRWMIEKKDRDYM